MPQFCRHNRFQADCPICSKGTVLDPERPREARPRSSSGGRKRRASKEAPPAYRGPYATAGPYDDEGALYEIRLERVPGGLRLAEWHGGSIRRRAPVLLFADLPALVRDARESGALSEADGQALEGAVAGEPSGPGSSPGRAGELREELRAEPLDDGRIRIGRWILRPGSGWELQQAPVMLPPARYVEALAAACR
jgi:hypothetical protein